MRATFGAFKESHMGEGIYWAGTYNVEGVGNFATLSEARTYAESIVRTNEARRDDTTGKISARMNADGTATFLVPGHSERTAVNRRKAGNMAFDLSDEFGMEVVWL